MVMVQEVCFGGQGSQAHSRKGPRCWTDENLGGRPSGQGSFGGPHLSQASRQEQCRRHLMPSMYYKNVDVAAH